MKRPTRRPSTSPAVVRLVGYARVSTAEQADKGVSLDAQRERLAAYAKAHGYDLLRVETDAGLSGGLPPHKRAGLTAALEAVRSGEADGILAVKLDRLSRSVTDTLDLIARSERDGWRLASVSENLDTGTAVGRMIVTVLAALGQMEREQIGERTTAAMAQVAREGRARSRFLPWGYRYTRRDTTEAIPGERAPLVVDKSETAVLVTMLALKDAGKGARRIAAHLNAEGTGNPRTGGPWNYGTVAAILRTHERRALLDLDPTGA